MRLVARIYGADGMGDCEVLIPCDATPAEANYPGKVCALRSQLFTENVFRQLATCYCYNYTNPILRRPVKQLTIKPSTCTDSTTNITFPCIKFKDNSTMLLYDHKNKSTVTAMAEAFRDDIGLQKWLQCSEAALNCCEATDSDGINPGAGYCPATWDGWYCWSKASENTHQQGACPDYVYVEAPPTCDQHSVKHCMKNGRWNDYTNYGPCSSNPINMMSGRLNYHVVMLSLSIAICIPALVIFCSYRKLQVTRVTLHRNLVLAIIVRNSFSVAIKKAIVLRSLGVSSANGNLMQENPIWCRALSFLDRLSGSAVYSCMLLEGVFLHRIIAAAFRGEPDMRLYYVFATVLACVPVIAWTIVIALHDNENCWAVAQGDFPWIFDGPRIFAMCVNAILMMDIVRVLLTKMRKVNTNKSIQIRRMTRATIFLIPLFGVQFLLTSYRPKTRKCDYEQVYYYTFYTMDGLQGAIVALLYCYLNREVQVQLIKTYQHAMVRLFQFFGRDYAPGPRPTWQYSDPRSTATSLVYDDKPRPSILSLQVGDINTPPEAPRSSVVSFRDDDRPRSSLGGPKRSILATKLRKVSCVKEEDSPPDTPNKHLVINGNDEGASPEEHITYLSNIPANVKCSISDSPEMSDSARTKDETDGFFMLEELPVRPEEEEQDLNVRSRKESRKSSKQHREKVEPRISDIFRPGSLNLHGETDNLSKTSRKSSKQQKHRGSLPGITDLFRNHNLYQEDSDNSRKVSHKSSERQKHRGSLPGIIDLFRHQSFLHEDNDNSKKFSHKSSEQKHRGSLPRISHLFSSQNLQDEEHRPRRSYTKQKPRGSIQRTGDLLSNQSLPEESRSRNSSKHHRGSVPRISDLFRSRSLLPSENTEVHTSMNNEGGSRRLSDLFSRQRPKQGQINQLSELSKNPEPTNSDVQNRSLSVSLKGLGDLIGLGKKETATVNSTFSMPSENITAICTTQRDPGEESTI